MIQVALPRRGLARHDAVLPLGDRLDLLTGIDRALHLDRGIALAGLEVGVGLGAIDTVVREGRRFGHVERDGGRLRRERIAGRHGGPVELIDALVRVIPQRVRHVIVDNDSTPAVAGGREIVANLGVSALLEDAVGVRRVRLGILVHLPIQLAHLDILDLSQPVHGDLALSVAEGAVGED